MRVAAAAAAARPAAMAMRVAAAVVTTVWLGLLAAGPARAGLTQYWTLESPEDFLKCKSRGVALGGEARAAVGPQVDSLGSAAEPLIWAVATGPGGTVFAGTGHGGKILRGARGARLVEWASTGEPEVLSVASDGGGGVYAGTGPKGRVFHVDAQGHAKLLASLPAEYVWALLRDTDGALFAGTGASGRIFRVSPSGAFEEYWDSPAGHIVCLAWGARHELLAGGEEDGVVYELTQKGRGRALYEADEKEIRSLAVTPSGQIYAAALKVALQPPSSAAPGSNAAPSGLVGDKSSRSAVYRLLPNGAATKVWEGPGLVYSLTPRGESVLAATGEDSQLWRLDPDGSSVKLLELDAGSILCAAPDGSDLILGTGNPGGALRVRARPATSGTLESTTLDGKRVSGWGGLFAEGAQLSEVQFSVRSGNTDPPDRSWSDWMPYRTGNVTAPAARYLRWRAELRDGATLRRVRVAYREQNLPPEVHAVQVLPQEPRALLGPPEGSATVSQTLAGGVKVDYSLPRQSTRPASFDISAWARGIRHIRWDASDPNSDPLHFALDYRAVGERNWKPLARELDDNIYAWDTTSLPDGRYEIRVTASDSTLNSPSEARSASRVSEPTIIDHTPPRWSSLGASHPAAGLVHVTGTARDDLSPLVYLAYSLDGGDWVVLEPVDGVLDSPEEGVSFNVQVGAGDEHTLMLKAVDLSGNVGSSSLTLH